MVKQHFVVIGNPIAHSKSPEIHQHFAKQVGLDINYSKQYCPNDTSSFEAVVTAFFHGGGIGANVTVPFKQMAFELCQEQGGLSKHALAAGAVNTLMLRQGRLFGDNTDGQGLVNHLQALNWPLEQAQIAIIGAGGAARGIVLPLLEAGAASITIANRTVSKAQQLIDDLQSGHERLAKASLYTKAINELNGEYNLIINATSIGLSEDTLPLSKTLQTTYAYDMMYGRKLPFLQHFAKLGATTSDGFGMLVGQAALSFERWTGHRVDSQAAIHILQR
ncbi:MAG: shikimate dehydrogenase [Psychrobacter sp.]|nr:shikimate dehydrogenase [Psychrobacter sp.]